MKKRITAFSIIIMILISNAASLFASGHADCKMKDLKADNHCEKMEMKMDCCPSEKPVSEKCACPEMNNNEDGQNETDPFVLLKILENSGKIVLQLSNIYQLDNSDSKRSCVISFNTLNPNKKIYKVIHSYLI